MKLIVGLGNPGKEYENTRHNVGFDVIDKYTQNKNITSTKTKFDGVYYEEIINNEKIIFLKPQKYMNLSGEVVKKYVDYFKINIQDILIIHDDLDQEIGKIKLKQNSSSGGHNGIKNIELHLNTKQYKRLKIGISNNKSIDTKDFVLGKFNKKDRELIDNSINICLNIIDDFFILDFDKLMNKYN
ncbi:MAG: aminoacyl-tRNA hydrolase [Bacilli bacterium]|nr:aminoacyl-tRNA hydrolase [Bacilli bacterium]